MIRFSADVYSYFTAPEALRVWGSIMQAYPKPEGALFFGLVPIALLGLAVLAALAPSAHAPGKRDGLTWFIVAVILIQLSALVAILFTGGFVTTIVGLPIRATNPGRLATGIGIACGILLAVSPHARRALRAGARSPLTLAVVLTGLALWLSLGPLPQSRGRVLSGLGLYGVLYDYVPGFDGLRAPARYAMVAAVFLSIAAGYGVAALMNPVTRRALVATAITVSFLGEVAFAPMPINQTWGDGGVTPPSRVEPRSTAPPVYRALAMLPEARVITEFPSGVSRARDVARGARDY